jgi:hypothetical protein
MMTHASKPHPTTNKCDKNSTSSEHPMTGQ